MEATEERGVCDHRNVMSYLRARNFPAAQAELLGNALKTVPRGRILDAMANRSVHGSFNLALVDILQYFVNNNPANWEIVAKALEKIFFSNVAEEVRKYAGKPCTLSEIQGALLKSGFSSSYCEDLGRELKVPTYKLNSIMADKGVARNAGMALSDIIEAWFQNERHPTWEKVDMAIDEVTQANRRTAGVANNNLRQRPQRQESPTPAARKGDPNVQGDGGHVIKEAKIPYIIVTVLCFTFIVLWVYHCGSNQEYSWHYIAFIGITVLLASVIVYLLLYKQDAHNAGIQADGAKSTTSERDSDTENTAHSNAGVQGDGPGSTANVYPASEEDCSDQSFNIDGLQLNPEYYNVFGPKLGKVHGKGITGEGIKIAIIDRFDGRYGNEGIMRNHKALEGANLTTVNMTREGDEFIHTEHALICTAIVVGQPFKDANHLKTGRKCNYQGGIAPKANATLFLVNHDKSHKSELAALEEVANGNFDVLSMSFGGNTSWAENSIKKIQETTNTIMVAAAGNKGGIQGVVKPASYEGVISVGSLDSYYCNKSAFSPKGKKVQVFFPGEIMVPVVGDNRNHDQFDFSVGTSMATPGVAGLICLLLEKAKKEGRTLNREDVLNYLNKMIVPDSGLQFEEPIEDFFLGDLPQ